MLRYVTLCSTVFLSHLLVAPAWAAGCGDTQAWRLAHEKANPTTETFDLKGSRNTSLEICREAEPSGSKATVTLLFEGHPQPLAEGDCHSRLARWAVVRSIGAESAPGQPAVVKGTAKVCRE